MSNHDEDLVLAGVLDLDDEYKQRVPVYLHRQSTSTVKYRLDKIGARMPTPAEHSYFTRVSSRVTAEP